MPMKTTRETPAAALIFDMDGTIVDNMRYHEDAWERLHTAHGLPFDRASFFANTAVPVDQRLAAARETGFLDGTQVAEAVLCIFIKTAGHYRSVPGNDGVVP